MPSVLHVCAFDDNYIWLVHGASHRHVAIVDPGDAEPVIAAIEELALVPAAVLCTHHHGDHVGGVATLAERFGMPVYGPATERIDALTHRVRGGSRVALDPLELELDVLDVPGHTAGHIAYYAPGLLFCGDTLFSAGCGRLFEGTPGQMYRSLERLAALPGDTAVYCAHEYTLANLRFAATVEPDNDAVRTHIGVARAQRARGEPTLPSILERELRINPFLRTAEPAVREALERHTGRPLPAQVERFAALRRWKDGFRV